MRSIKARFEEARYKHPDYSSYMQFSMAVEKQNFNYETIQKWFTKLVDVSDYDSKEKTKLCKFLCGLSSKHAEERQIEV